MKLPEKAQITNTEFQRLYSWYIKEYFYDKKIYWADYYKDQLNNILSACKEYIPNGGTILDIGCAQATASILLAEHGFMVFATDINPESLKYAKLRYEYGDYNFIALSAEHLPFKMKFDAIILGEFLEHVYNPQQLLKIYINYLKPNGIIIITTPNKNSPHNYKFMSFSEFSKLKSHDEVSNKFGPEREDRIFNFTFSELESVIISSGYKIIKSKYINSYLINPLNLHRFFPNSLIDHFNNIGSNIPVFNKYTSIGLFFVIKKNGE